VGPLGELHLGFETRAFREKRKRDLSDSSTVWHPPRITHKAEQRISGLPGEGRHRGRVWLFGPLHHRERRSHTQRIARRAAVEALNALRSPDADVTFTGLLKRHGLP
jgi:hypothetical protein